MLLGLDVDDEWYKTWIGIVNDALSCLYVEKVNGKVIAKWSFLPNGGGLYDQDEWIMFIWEIVKMEYLNAMNDSDFLSNIKKIRVK